MNRMILVVCSLLLFSQAAMAEKNAGLFVEPLISYEMGDGEVNYPSPISSSDADLNGFGVGTRLGVHFKEAFFLGIDGRYSMPQFKDSGLDMKTDAKAWNYGPVAGVQLPWLVGLRVWGGYIMDGQVDPDKDNNIKLKFTDGRGYRVGTGIKLGIVSLNLEYQDMTYDKTKVQEVGVFNPGTIFNNVELDNKTWLLSVSFPLSL